MKPVDEPALKSYFFGKGYQDLWATIVESWQRNLTSAQDHFAKTGTAFSKEMPEKAMAVLWLSAGISVIVFGTFFFLTVSMLHIAVLFSLFLVIYLIFSVIYLLERVYLLVKGFSAVCPQCHGKYPLPHYLCSKCGKKHRKLIPSKYGILFRRCQCGKELPSTFFLEREKLTALCPDEECGYTMDSGNFIARKAFVSVVGGPAVGKSAFLFSAVEQLIERKLPGLGLRTSFLDSHTEAEFQGVKGLLDQGLPPTKTVKKLPRALNLRVEGEGETTRVLYLYDPAGEAYGETAGLVEHRYQDYFSGMVFLVDPFSIPLVRAEYAGEVKTFEDPLRPSDMLIEDALARVLIGLEEHFDLAKTAQIKKPIAVVVNKIDAFDLEQRIGEEAVLQRLRENPALQDLAAARDLVIREQLLLWDQGAFLQQLEARFRKVRYFACSSLGRMPDTSGQAFEGRGILDPLMWILGTSDPIFQDVRAQQAA